MNDKLAIAIPTYNRPSILKENLILMMPEIKKFDIAVYISDDSPNDETCSIISDFKEVYDNIFYCKNEPALGHDNNCLKTLSLPDSDYIWYLGDSQIIGENGIETIINTINEKTFDIILVSACNRSVKINSHVYTDPNNFFTDLAWHGTLTGVTIYKKSILFRADYSNFIGTNFIQLGIVLEELLDSENGLFWINKDIIYGNKSKSKSYWNNMVFKVFAEDWYNFIINLPNDYKVSEKMKVIRSHSDNTGIFKIRNYLKLRADNILNLKSFLKYKNKLKDATSLNIYLVFILTLIPRFIFVLLSYFKKSSIVK